MHVILYMDGDRQANILEESIQRFVYKISDCESKVQNNLMNKTKCKRRTYLYLFDKPGNIVDF